MCNVRCMFPANCIFCDDTKISLSIVKTIKIKRILRQNLYKLQYHATSLLYKYIYYWKSVSNIQFLSFYTTRSTTFNVSVRFFKFQCQINIRASQIISFLRSSTVYPTYYIQEQFYIHHNMTTLHIIIKYSAIHSQNFKYARNDQLFARTTAHINLLPPVGNLGTT